MNNLTRALHGVIEAHVSGGTAVYRQIFFAEKFLKENSQNPHLVSQLKEALTEQVKTLHKGLAIHKSKINANLEPIHLAMEEDLKKLEKEQNL